MKVQLFNSPTRIRFNDQTSTATSSTQPSAPQTQNYLPVPLPPVSGQDTTNQNPDGTADVNQPSDQAQDKPWYQKPITWILGGLALVGGAVALLMRKPSPAAESTSKNPSVDPANNQQNGRQPAPIDYAGISFRDFIEKFNENDSLKGIEFDTGLASIHSISSADAIEIASHDSSADAASRSKIDKLRKENGLEDEKKFAEFKFGLLKQILIASTKEDIGKQQKELEADLTRLIKNPAHHQQLMAIIDELSIQDGINSGKVIQDKLNAFADSLSLISLDDFLAKGFTEHEHKVLLQVYSQILQRFQNSLLEKIVLHWQEATDLPVGKFKQESTDNMKNFLKNKKLTLLTLGSWISNNHEIIIGNLDQQKHKDNYVNLLATYNMIASSNSLNRMVGKVVGFSIVPEEKIVLTQDMLDRLSEHDLKLIFTHLKLKEEMKIDSDKIVTYDDAQDYAV